MQRFSALRGRVSMRNGFVLAGVACVLVIALGCSQDTPQQGAATPPAATTDSTTPAAAVPSTGTASGLASSGTASSGATAAQSTAKPVAEQASAKPAAPSMMPMDVPAGTALQITLDTPVASDTSKVEDTVRGKVAKAVVISGMTAIPAGSLVKGTVVAAEEAGRVKGRASVALRFNEVTVANTPYKIQTTRIVREAEATKGEDAKKIGIGAGVGTAIGAIAGGKKGAAIGAGIGAGAGTGAVLATKGDEVRIGAGATLKTTIDDTVRVNAPM